MTTDPETTGPGSTGSEQSTPQKSVDWIARGISVLTLAGFMACLGVMLPFVIGYHLLFGWMAYLKRVLSTQTLVVSQLVWLILFLALIVVALHLLLKQGYHWSQRLQSTEPDAAPLNSWPKQWTCSVLLFLLILAGSGVAITEIGRQVWSMSTGDERLVTAYNSYNAARRNVSKNYLKQIGLALHNYHDLHDRLPPGGIFNQTGQPQHSWMTQILPYVDQVPLYNKVDFHQPWTSADNRDIFTTELYVYQIPGPRLNRKEPELPHGYQPAGYAANARVLNVNSGLNFKEIKDGLSNTLLAGEVNSQLKAWGDPTNFREPALGINAHPRGFGGPFKGGANCLLGDGSARFINENIDPAVLKALATPNGGEDMSRFQEDW